ncbi:MAG TPA: cupin domain-containing protein [Gaiellaceae bacterium]
MRVFNLFDGELDHSRDVPGFSWRRAAVGEQIGGQRLGASLYELQPGERSFPYHYEYGAEEWLFVVAGRPTLRDPEGEHELRPGDVVAFPEGPDGAHLVRNDTDEPVRVLVLSTKGTPNAAVYPDSGKIGVWTGFDELDPPRLFRIGTEVDYWDGEGA